MNKRTATIAANILKSHGYTGLIKNNGKMSSGEHRYYLSVEAPWLPIAGSRVRVDYVRQLHGFVGVTAAEIAEVQKALDSGLS